MAFTATTNWDVRTTGNDNNGGGFDVASTGTDRSQQDAAYIAFTDLVIGSTNTQLTSAAHPFDATSVGNVINVTGGSGFTVQRVQIVSVSSAVATCDKACGTASSTGGTGNLGGALATIGAAAAAQAAGAVGFNTIHVKSGTYTITSAIALSPGGSGAPDVYLIGYQTSHNDGGTKPLVTTATNGIDLFQPEGTYGAILFRNFSMSHTASTRGRGMCPRGGGNYPELILQDCIMDGFTNAINGDNGSSTYVFNSVVLINTEIKNSQSDAVRNQGYIYCYGSYIHNNSGSGLYSLSSNNLIVEQSIIASNTVGINATVSATVVRISSSSIANNSGDGVTVASLTATAPFVARNCIFYGNGGYGVNLSAFFATSTNISGHNAYGSNTSGNRNNFSAGTGDVALTANPFTNAAAGDYSLNSTAGGGAACKGAGTQWGS